MANRNQTGLDDSLILIHLILKISNLFLINQKCNKMLNDHKLNVSAFWVYFYHTIYKHLAYVLAIALIVSSI